jgi:carboxyl-terminal processing protease
MAKQHRLTTWFNSRAKSRITKGHIIGAVAGTALAIAFEFGGGVYDAATSETHNFLADNLITTTVPAPSAALVASQAPDSDVFIFGGFAGLEQNELDFVVSEHYQRIERTAQIAANYHYDVPKYEDVIQGHDVVDIVRQLAPEKSYTHDEIKALVETSANKMLKALDYRSMYINHNTAKRWNDSDNNISHSFGINLAPHPKGIIVDFVEDGPARKVGLQQGDIITHINNEDLSVLPPYQRIPYTRDIGRTGEATTFKGVKHKTDAPYSFEITAGEVKTTPVRAQIVNESSLLIKLSSFSHSSNATFRNAIITAQDKYGDKLENIIIDLRDNGGGFVYAVNDMLDDVTDGDTLGYIQTRINTDSLFSQAYAAFQGKDHYEDHIDSTAGQITALPIRVLIDDDSASASEIFAGNLQDVGRAQIIGKTASFGKATMQRPFDIGYNKDDLSKIKITMGAVFLPQSGSYQGIGIQPDILVTPDFEGQTDHAYFEKDNDNILRNPSGTSAKASPFTCSPHRQDDDSLKQIWVENTDIYSGYTKKFNIGADTDLLCAIDSFNEETMYTTIKENSPKPSV